MPLGHRALGDSRSGDAYQVTMAANAVARATATASFEVIMILGATAYARASASAVFGSTTGSALRMPAVFLFTVPADR